MTTSVETLSASIDKISTIAVNNQTVFALKLTLLKPAGGLDYRATCYMTIYSSYLQGRHSPSRMALAAEGDVLNIELRGLVMRASPDDDSCIFAEFDDILTFTAKKPHLLGWK